MQYVLDRLDEACEALPAEMCSSSRDPGPLLRVLFHAERGIELCQTCLDKYYERDLDSEAERGEARRKRAAGWKDLSGEPDDDEEEEEGGEVSRPWRTAGWREWFAWKERALALSHRWYDRLAHVYRPEPELVYRPGECVALLWAHLELCAQASHPEAELSLRTLRAADFAEAVAGQELAVSEDAVLHYSMSSLMDATYRLLSLLHRLRFSIDLARYLWLLELRTAQLLVYTGDAATHDLPEYRQKVKGGGGEEYACNRRFLSDVTTLVVALHARFVVAMQCPRRDPTPEELEEDAPLREALRAWFVDRARAMTTDVASEWFERAYVAALLRPREKEIFRRDFPQDTCTDLTVLSKYRSHNGEYRRIMQETERPVKDIVLRDAAKPSESLSLQFALHEMLGPRLEPVVVDRARLRHAAAGPRDQRRAPARADLSPLPAL